MSIVPLNAVELGTGDPPLVLLHGFTGNALDWSQVQPVLAEDRRVIAFEHRGHGKSPNLGNRDGYSFDLLLADFLAALDELGLDSIHLLGHSMGGVVSQRVALAAPHRLASLILMDTAAQPTGDGIPIEMVEGLVHVGRTQGMAAAYELIAGAVGHTDAGLEKFTDLDPEAMLELAHELNRYPSMLAELKDLRVPTTVIVGANDLGLRAAADDLAREIPHAELLVIPDAGHSPQEDQPEAWLAAVRSHFGRVST